MTAAPQPNTSSPAEYFSLRDIARASGINKRTLQRQAEREGWPCRMNGNRLEFQPPENISDVLVAAPSAAPACKPAVRFADLSHSDAARARVLLREQAVKLVQANISIGKEKALELVSEHMRREHPLFQCKKLSLRQWCAAYSVNGLDGLVEQKRGRVGRKSFASDLDTAEILRATAAANMHGIKGRLNIARGYQTAIVANPTLNARARTWAHGDHASKSYVPPSVRDALRAHCSPLAARLIQIGPKAAKLDGPHSICSYDATDIRAITADDMTANCYVWSEWPNEQGFLLIRPQILALMNVGTMAWLNLRAVMRPKGQYTKDDVWGLLGDYLDDYGLHVDANGRVDQIAVLEGGTWQSNVVIGHKTGLDDETRFGGLRSLGVKVIHTRTPRGKIIEGAFNVLQHAADNVRGFCGRDERRDCPEAVKQQLAQVKAGKAHPRQYFLSHAEYTDHLHGVMNSLNNERNDGVILRGRTPTEAWAEINAHDNANFIKFPDESKWMYRAAYNLVQVTRNGVRVTIGTGKYQKAYSYSHPGLEIHRSRRVCVFWNDYDPDTDAVIYAIKSGRPDQLICVASRVQELPRFGATEDQFAAEAARKKLLANVAVTQRRTLAPYLTRTVAVSPPSPKPVNQQLTAARAEQDRRVRARKTLRQFTGDADELLGDRAVTHDASRLAPVTETDLSADALL